MSSFYILVKLNILHLYNYFDSPRKLFSDPNLAKFLNISAKPFFPRIHMFINYPFCSIKICIFFFMNKVKLHPGLWAYKIRNPYASRIFECIVNASQVLLRMMKAVRTMYREKLRYVHLNVKRSTGKWYYVKNSARRFIR